MFEKGQVVRHKLDKRPMIVTYVKDADYTGAIPWVRCRYFSEGEYKEEEFNPEEIEGIVA